MLLRLLCIKQVSFSREEKMTLVLLQKDWGPLHGVPMYWDTYINVWWIAWPGLSLKTHLLLVEAQCVNTKNEGSSQIEQRRLVLCHILWEFDTCDMPSGNPLYICACAVHSTWCWRTNSALTMHKGPRSLPHSWRQKWNPIGSSTLGACSRGLGEPGNSSICWHYQLP